jgi:very-short-patch-repair endonuclease
MGVLLLFVVKSKSSLLPSHPLLRWGGVGGGGTMPRRGTMPNRSSRPIDERVKRAREFRHDPTEAEKKLWRYLRQLSPDRSHFRRQATTGPYFADFACHRTRIVIEVDGGQHADSESDARRTSYLEANGYRVLRFWNHDVLGNIEGVVEAIMSAVGVGEGPPPPGFELRSNRPPHQRTSKLDLRGERTPRRKRSAESQKSK